MNYSNVNTILVYLVDSNTLEIAYNFTKSNSLQLMIANCETDLIAAPNLFIITNINRLTNETFSYIEGFEGEGIFEDEMLISFTEPESDLALKYAKYFQIKPDISFQYLEEILPERINIRESLRSSL
jgi:hypothetical protein